MQMIRRHWKILAFLGAIMIAAAAATKLATANDPTSLPIAEPRSIEPPMTKGPASDDELKAQFLATLGDNDPSFRDLRRRLGWSQETFYRIVDLLAAEHKIKTDWRDEDEDYKQTKRQFRYGLLKVRPKWLGRLLYITGVITQWMSFVTLLAATAVLAWSADEAYKMVASRTGPIDFFHWSSPLFRWSIITMIVGLVGMMYDDLLFYVSARAQGTARPIGFFKLLFHVIGVAPRTLWMLFLVVLREHGPPGEPPEDVISVRADGPVT